ncbi:hypothetical protein POTOM_045091 [Populus tomentosa]|uniref:Uncharacterized protein n=1 Tax=Populus tomentosa TaxID=118781 RepID=A0A8X7YCG7_POPTO|nr:hypothetical protein POTOM_045091 [Populus tomentosa]
MVLNLSQSLPSILEKMSQAFQLVNLELVSFSASGYTINGIICYIWNTALFRFKFRHKASGYGTKTIKDYFDGAKEMTRPDGGPPRWFCPIERGQPLKCSPTLLFLPGNYCLVLIEFT